ncbi:MAG: serine/threonine protein kinase, partial [Deltaproteobacteria bacterium]|nr:serine/threonine protein kinase [Deltaproteobacteria bacterium]
MTRTVRIAIAAAAALALLAVAYFATSAIASGRAADQRVLQQQLGEQAAAKAKDALQARLSVLQARTETAAQLPALVAQIGRVDWNTLKDGFLSEPWWASVRAEASIYGIAMEGPTLDFVVGLSGGLSSGDLVLKARQDRKASALRLSQGQPFLMATSVIDKPGLSVPPVLLLARPFDDALFSELGQRIEGAAILSDGKTKLASLGTPTLLKKLDGLVGAEGDEKKRPPIAQATLVSQGLWLWTYPPPPPATDGGLGLTIAIWVVAAVLAVLAIVFGVRGPAEPQTTYVVHTTLPPGELPEEGAMGVEVRAQTIPGQAPPRRTSMPPQRAPGSTSAGKSNPNRTNVSNPGGRPGVSNPGKRPGVSNPGAARVQQPDPNEVTGEDPTMLPTTGEADPVNPNQFGRYLLLDVLGEGGMAEVFTAVAHGVEGFKRTFVVKRLRREMVGRKDVETMFIDEARPASAFVHSNIIPVFDFGKIGEEYFMATEYILGRDFGRVARRALEVDGKGLKPEYVVFIVRETLRALEYAHQKTDDDGKPMGIVHRDISPNNVLVSVRGEVKLFDFGIAKAEGRLTETQAGTVKGNYKFMSSEQAYGSPVDQRSDLASLGLTMYYALAGDALYDGDSAYGLILKAAKGPEAAEIERIKKVAPGKLADILLKSIIADRDQRYANASEFLAALSAVPAADGAAMAKEMNRLFGEELRGELNKLQAQTKSSGTTGEGKRAPAAEGMTSRAPLPALALRAAGRGSPVVPLEGRL